MLLQSSLQALFELYFVDVSSKSILIPVKKMNKMKSKHLNKTSKLLSGAEKPFHKNVYSYNKDTSNYGWQQ